jgi:CBS domain-containing protein
MAETRQQDTASVGEAGQRGGRSAQETHRATAAALRQGGEAVAEAGGRAGQAGATAIRGGGEAAAELAQRSGQAAGHVARRGAREFAEEGRRYAHEAADDIEMTADRFAETLGQVAHDMGRLMMVPRSAGGGIEEMQEAMGSLLNGVMRTNLRMTQELFRRANPGGVVELQGALLHEYIDTMLEGGSTILRATRRTADEALRPLERRGGRRGAEGRRNGEQRLCVAEVMSRNVRVVNPDETVQQAARLMAEEDAGALPVGENDRLIGMLTDRDLALRVLAEGKDPARTKTRDAMTAGTHYLFEDEDIDSATEKMEREQVRRMPVLNRAKRLVGIVSLGDVARHADRQAGHALAGIARQGGRHNQSEEMTRP